MSSLRGAEAPLDGRIPRPRPPGAERSRDRLAAAHVHVAAQSLAECGGGPRRPVAGRRAPDAPTL